jgi:hypothetical protein
MKKLLALFTLLLLATTTLVGIAGAVTTINDVAFVANANSGDNFDLIEDDDGNFILYTNREPTTAYNLQFHEDTEASEDLAEDYFPLFLVDTTEDLQDLKDYYTDSGYPEPYLSYLHSAVDGDSPFVMIYGDGTTEDVELVDATQLHFDNTSIVDMIIPGDYPVGTYTVSGDIRNLDDEWSYVEFTLIIKESSDLDVVINEFESNPKTGSEWIELYNTGDLAVDISGWEIYDGLTSARLRHTVPAKTNLAGDSYYTVEITSLNDKSEFITLFNDEDTVIDETPTLADEDDDENAWARVPNGEDTDDEDDWEFQAATRGIANDADTTAPVISATATGTITQTSAVITWTTDEDATSVVEYGTTTALGSTKESATLTKSHSVTLDSLTSGSVYYYQVKSTDVDGNTATDNNASAKYTFTATSNTLTLTGLDKIVGEANETTETFEKKFTIDSGDSGIDRVYFTVGDLKHTTIDDTDATIAASKIKFFEGTTEITANNLLHLSSKEITINIDIPDEDNIDYFGDYQTTLSVKDAAGTVKQTATINVELNPRDHVDLGSKINIDDWEVPDDTVYRKEEITVSVNIENSYSEDIEDVIVYLRNAELDIDEKSSKFDLDEDDDVDVTFTFEIPDDASAGDYELYAFVEAQDTEDSSNDLFEYDVSGDKVDVNVESHHLVVELKLDQEQVNTGTTVGATAKVFNAGRDKEKSLTLRIFNTDLGVDETVRYSDISSEKAKTHAFLIPVLAGTTDGVYKINVDLSYKDDDRQDEDEIENDLKTEAFLTVGKGGSVNNGDNNNDNSQTKDYLSGATTVVGQAGKQIKYALTFKNVESSVKEFEVKVSGYNDWASEGKAEPSTKFSLGPGSSIPIFVYFTSEADATDGAHTALLTVYVNGQIASTESLMATISGGDTTGGQLDPGVVTGGSIADVSGTTVIIAISIIVAIVLLSGIYMFTIGRR